MNSFKGGRELFMTSRFFSNNLIFFFLSFYILLIVSSILSNYILISLKSSLLSIRFAILTFAIIHVSKKINCFLKFFFISSFLCMALLFLSGVSQFFFNEDYWVISELINTSYNPFLSFLYLSKEIQNPQALL